jgi:hypothetical protein
VSTERKLSGFANQDLPTTQLIDCCLAAFGTNLLA